MSHSLADVVKDRLTPTPTSELSWPRKLRRGFGFLLFLSSLAMAVSAATANSDWDIQSDGTKGHHDTGSGDGAAKSDNGAESKADSAS